mmetsp:Transcript_24936/g.79179  ORF Transcript_24936/g.79179 Transcript_24936/m.79179 type:complete len:218 (-) Transcript_24936:1186-1839(-)
MTVSPEGPGAGGPLPTASSGLRFAPAEALRRGPGRGRCGTAAPACVELLGLALALLAPVSGPAPVIPPPTMLRAGAVDGCPRPLPGVSTPPTPPPGLWAVAGVPGGTSAWPSAAHPGSTGCVQSGHSQDSSADARPGSRPLARHAAWAAWPQRSLTVRPLPCRPAALPADPSHLKAQAGAEDPAAEASPPRRFGTGAGQRPRGCRGTPGRVGPCGGG